MNSIAVDQIRLEVTQRLDPECRSAFGQFMTPSAIARFMASLFSSDAKAIRLLDAGAGVGSLTAAFIEAHREIPTEVEAWEVDPTLRGYLERVLAEYATKKVAVSDSHDGEFADYRERGFPFDRIVKADDCERFIHVPSLDTEAAPASSLFACTLKEIGIEVCTGPVVDFRLREQCRAQPEAGTVPLLYAHHFPGGQLAYPVEHKKKPNAILATEQTAKWLMPGGYYVLTRRFSAKEERRRVVAFVVDPDDLPASSIGFENHLNVFHVGKHGLDRETAYGLALFLNSTLVDACFRAFSGHTQVNATDLRQMRYPAREQLKAIGRWVGRRRLAQAEIDDYILSAAVPFR